MLDTRSDPAMLGVVGFLAGQQGPAGSFAVRDDQAGVDVGAVAERGDAAALVRQTGVAPHMGVGLVARGRAGGGHDQACVGIDDDLHVRGEPVVAARGTDLAVADRDKRAIHDPQPVRSIDRT
ncbi:hypothetical protein GCM10009574_090790 [Streptomyces asiaticus]|uniref:Uncharacterized protein n=2 Tax=Streptomyces rhizosphaericus TaxID=114699 RepID=A0ABP4D2K9_9ACTN